MFGIIVPEPTLPLGAMPDAMRSAAWSAVYQRMALFGGLAALGGGGIGYALAGKKRKGRGVAYGALGVGAGAALVTFLIGWRQVKTVNALYDAMTSAGGAVNIFNLPTG